ncbi:BTAD domain-containing putative transcriptional regulator [Dactylosporangium sp. CA-233914]|uniref:BTAD domain-containing putative transcriptional regulator n=1 Tax=Dactylosporangium sp. CA-233914 TaxID=3239934 RepID=UPI003D8F5735
MAIPGTAWAVDPVANQVIVSIDPTVPAEHVKTIESLVASLGAALRPAIYTGGGVTYFQPVTEPLSVYGVPRTAPGTGRRARSPSVAPGWQSWGMRVGLLGPLAVEIDGRPVEVGGARLRTLVARLAMEPSRFVPVEQLVDALWPDGPAPADPANAVQSLVSRLRKTLGGHPALESGPRGYRLGIEPDDVDASRFEHLVAQGRRDLRADAPAAAARSLRAALALWRGPAPAELGPVVARWDELRLAATEDLIEASGFSPDARPAAIAQLRELVAAHPLRERLVALLIRALHADGRQAEALAEFEQCRRRLADGLGADPSPELRDAHVSVLRAEARPGRAGNLRATLTSFVGRTGDVERLAAQVADARLVTLVGPGGAGKTRLATTVASGLTPSLPDGAWLVELAPVAEASEVPAAVLRVLVTAGLAQPDTARRPRRGDIMDQLADALSLPGILLVLDNCEHVVDAAAALAEELLGRCPKLRILATSREPLAILGETLFPVGPLPIPPPALPAPSSPPAPSPTSPRSSPPPSASSPPPAPAAPAPSPASAWSSSSPAPSPAPPDGAVAEALRSPAVQLLRDRAAAVRPGFAVTSGNVAAVVEICRRLDGLPLAIELAAARLRTFTPEQVAARLDDRFRLLTGGSRTALPRHRTLHAVVAWSWELLGPQERAFAESLAVFPGTFDADAAAAVSSAEPAAGSGPVRVGDAEDLLHTLVDRSLLQVADGGGRVRYRMLETIREFALEEIGRRGAAGAVRAAHAAYFLALMERAEPNLRTGEQLEWLERLRPERDNLHAAVAYFCDSGDAVGAFRIGAASGWFWTFEDNHAEAAQWFRRILAAGERDPDAVPADLRLVVRSMYVVNSGFAGDFQVDPAQLSELVAMAATAPPGGHPFVDLIEPVVALFRDDTEHGAALVAARLAGPADTWTRAMLLSILGHLRENDGDIEGMLRELAASADAFRSVGERWGLAMTLASLADAHTRRGDFATAIANFEESIELYGRLGVHSSEAYLHVSMAALRRHTDGPAAARAMLREFVEDASRSPRDTSHAMLELGHLARAAGDLAEAERNYQESWRLQQESPLVAPQYKAIVVSARAEIDLARGELDLARTRLAEAMELALSARDMPVVGKIAVTVAGLRIAQGDEVLAATLLGAAEHLAGARDAANADWTRRRETLRAALGEEAFDTATARGLSLPRSDALELVAP